MPRTLNRLGNAKQVAAIKADGMHSDGGGLYLRIQRGGAARSWVVVSTKGGKRVERSLGPFDKLTLAEARARRDSPAALEAAAAPEAPHPAAKTFGEFADEIVPGIVAGFKNAKHRQQWENTTADIYIAPLRALPIDAVSTEDVLAVLRPIWLEKNETASRLRGRIERILGAAKAGGLRPIDSINPATWDGHLEHFLPKKRKDQKGHHKAMPWQALPGFLAQIRANGSTSALALEMCVLTWTRTTELTGMQLKEIDTLKGTWTIPKERMKLGKEHVVPLTPQMLAILREMTHGMNDPDSFVFPGRKKGRPLSNMAMLQLVRRTAGNGFTVHGFRSAARDWAGDATDHPREIAEMALAHAVGSDVEQAYRRGTALLKRRKLLEDWEGFLATGGNGPATAGSAQP